MSDLSEYRALAEEGYPLHALQSAIRDLCDRVEQAEARAASAGERVREAIAAGIEANPDAGHSHSVSGVSRTDEQFQLAERAAARHCGHCRDQRTREGIAQWVRKQSLAALRDADKGKTK